jgi:hypothetical protein
VQRQVATRVFHHLQHAQAKVFHCDTIHLPHLIFGQCWQTITTFS